MARTRLDAVLRILDVERQRRRIAETRLAELQRQEAALVASEAELMAALNPEQPLHGLFVGTMARRLRAISTELGAVRDRRAAAERRVLDHGIRVKRIERRVDALRIDARRAAERAELAAVIEQAVARDASLP